ncbi:PilZ domain-containing protein [Marinobacter sp. es.048]|nr:PilZ domain-containing protein [Marinobacter sp. es.048]
MRGILLGSSQFRCRLFFSQSLRNYTSLPNYKYNARNGRQRMTSDSAERRIKDRYPASCLKVQLRERGFLGRGKQPTPVTCLDLNRYGMAVLCPRPVEPGVRLFMDFDGKYINESRVCARVVECQPYQTGYRVSVQFSYCLDKKGYSRAVDNALSRIEGLYNRFAS